MNRLQVFIVVSFMTLAACSSAPTHNEDTSVSERQSPTMYHEQKAEQSLFGSTIQFWLQDHGLVEDHQDKRVIQGENQPVDRVVGSGTDQQLGHPTLQKPNRQVGESRSQQPVQRLNRPINRRFDRKN